METTLAAIGATAAASSTVRSIIQHVCEQHTALFAELVEWCETRHDCTSAVVCPVCRAQFVVDETDLVELRHWSALASQALGCGVRLE